MAYVCSTNGIANALPLTIALKRATLSSVLINPGLSWRSRTNALFPWISSQRKLDAFWNQSPSPEDDGCSGLVPLKPVVQLCALYQISIQEGGTLASLSTQSIRRLPPATLKQALSQPMIPLVLDWLADLLEGDEELTRVILLNRVTDDETVTRIAMGAGQGLCDLIAQNQTRLVRHPALIEALFFNNNARASTVDRARLAARNRLVLPNIPEYENIVAEIVGDLPQDEAEAQRWMMRSELHKAR